MFQTNEVLGKMKDEFNGVKINEFVGLKSKMYSLITDDDKEVNKAKGIIKRLRHKEYHGVLFNKKVIRHNMKRIQSRLHEIGTYDVLTISLRSFDDKRFEILWLIFIKTLLTSFVERMMILLKE